MMRFVCDLAAHRFPVDFRHAPVTVCGHKFIRTRFTICRPGGKSVVYFCKCGQFAFGDKNSGSLTGLADDGHEFPMSENAGRNPHGQ